MKKRLLIVAVLALLTVFSAVLHLRSQTDVPEHTILVNGAAVDIDSLRLRPVSGTVVTAAGEVRTVEAMGIPLSELCAGDVTVIASDGYRAEVGEEDDSYLIADGDGLRLVVFGDVDARRSVKKVVRIEER